MRRLWMSVFALGTECGMSRLALGTDYGLCLTVIEYNPYLRNYPLVIARSNATKLPSSAASSTPGGCRSRIDSPLE